MTLIFDPKLWIWDQVRCAYVLNIFPTKLCKSAQGPQSTSQQTDKQTDGLRVSWYRFNSIVTQDFYIDAHMTIWPVKLLIYRHDDTTLIWRIYWVNTTLNVTLILSEHNTRIWVNTTCIYWACFHRKIIRTVHDINVILHYQTILKNIIGHLQ